MFIFYDGLLAELLKWVRPQHFFLYKNTQNNIAQRIYLRDILEKVKYTYITKSTYWFYGPTSKELTLCIIQHKDNASTLLQMRNKMQSLQTACTVCRSLDQYVVKAMNGWSLFYIGLLPKFLIYNLDHSTNVVCEYIPYR